MIPQELQSSDPFPFPLPLMEVRAMTRDIENRWVCEPQITVRIPQKSPEVLYDTAGRLGFTCDDTTSEKGFSAGKRLVKRNAVYECELFRFLCVVEEPSNTFFLEAVVQTPVPAEKLPEGFKPDAGGFIRCETHSINTLIKWVYSVSALLGLEVPDSFNELVRWGYIPAGGSLASASSTAGRKLRTW